MFLTEYFTSVRVPDLATCHLRTPSSTFSRPLITIYMSTAGLCRPPGNNLTPNDPHGPRLLKLHGDTMLVLAMGRCTATSPTTGPPEIVSPVSLHLFWTGSAGKTWRGRVALFGVLRISLIMLLLIFPSDHGDGLEQSERPFYLLP